MEKTDQTTLDFNVESSNGPVTCIGLTFKNDYERREYFRDELRKKLPYLKEMEGYPQGSDDEVLDLSDPPFYTACPNPWINDILMEWKNNNNNDENYKREPYSSDISEGKNDAVYNAHSYHTKVPYKAIMKYLLHYTNPGDIVLDGFSGTGMTGVAAFRCGDIDEVKQLGYVVKDEKIFDQNNIHISNIGRRKALLNDLSPAASLITYNYNMNGDLSGFFQEADSLMKKVKEECSWMYEVKNNKNSSVSNVIWSDVFICPSCSNELIYWDLAVDIDKKQIHSEFNCKYCDTQLTKKTLERSYVTYFDKSLNETICMAKQAPVYKYYAIGKGKHEQEIDREDLDLLSKIDDFSSSYWFPNSRMPEGDESRRNDSIGLTHTHHFFTRRNLLVLATFYHYAKESRFFNKLLFFFQASITRATKTNRFRFGGTGGLSGTLYVPSLIIERNVISLLEKKLSDYKKILSDKYTNKTETIISTQSTSSLNQIEENSVDYIFTDPPFGKNLMYSELNFLWEAWLKVVTDNNDEAIMNNTQGKGVLEYQKIMVDSFGNYFKLLKPGRWMTVEFSNSQASVWNAIQESIQRAGFVIANVSALDKKQGSFKAVTTTTAVKQDLVISAYKPSNEIRDALRSIDNLEQSIWLFINQHLKQLPVFLGQKGEGQLIVERTPRILFDRLVSYYVQNGLNVPISSPEFQKELSSRFPQRDGMIFLEDQVAEYDKKRAMNNIVQMSWLVTDENSAIEWLRQQLLTKPQSRQDLHPNFMKEIQHIAKHELLPELDSLLEQNFLIYQSTEEVPSQIHSYLSSNYKDLRGLQKTDIRLIEKAKNRWYVPDPNKQADLEKLREKSLLREFEGYKSQIESNKKKLKQFRTESVRTGFKKAWSEKDYQTIVKIGERLPEKVLQEDDKLLMYFDNAQIRLGV
ncbi:DNA methyltransferase [Bacillus altitudinis]|uniref:DNA methyltransferase n=2 Tax=Bacillus altitudinis TaxID=293387 RepID=UPI002DB85966|nr:DNA methyltransferase [Bacillus altitudinis]MEC3811343.1 DNA methyltransferase [Bacillus altitudinis]